MVAFSYGEWKYICRVSPQPICNLFFRQLLVHPDLGVDAAPSPYLNLPQNLTDRQLVIKDMGLGILSSCSIPRMASAGGQAGSLGNIANIIICCFTIVIVSFAILQACRRKAAVARVEIIVLLALYSLMKLFEILDTGSILEQGSRSIVWMTSIHHAFTVIFYSTLVWLGFLSLQLIEDGSIFSLIPLAFCSVFLFVGSIYIFLDTGFGVSHYFSSQPASNLYSPWTFSLVVLWPFISVLIYLSITTVVSLRVLSEIKPVLVLTVALITFTMAESFRWLLTQPICHSSNAKVDGSFIASLFELMTLGLLYYVWVCLTEAEWADFDDLGYQPHQSGAVGYTESTKYYDSRSAAKLDDSLGSRMDIGNGSANHHYHPHPELHGEDHPQHESSKDYFNGLSSSSSPPFSHFFFAPRPLQPQPSTKDHQLLRHPHPLALSSRPQIAQCDDGLPRSSIVAQTVNSSLSDRRPSFDDDARTHVHDDLSHGWRSPKI